MLLLIITDHSAEVFLYIYKFRYLLPHILQILLSIQVEKKRFGFAILIFKNFNDILNFILKTYEF